MQDLVGALLNGRYRVIARIAGGGMGEVFRGHDFLLDRPVAIKVLQPSLAREPDLVARFRDEARAAARLAHQHVVAVHDWGEEEGTYFMVMEYVSGKDARDLLVARGALEPGQAVEVMTSVCEALAAAHASGLVHRDVKPENILIDRAGIVKVADFGIAAVQDADRTHPGGAIPGTLRYLAPEQARGGEATPASDVWAAGAVLAEMLTGRAVDHASPADLLRSRAEDPPTAPSAIDPSIPKELDKIVLRACAVDPADRYDSVGDMAEALRRAAVRSVRDAPPVSALLEDLTGEIRLDDMDPTRVTRVGRRLARRRRHRLQLVALISILAISLLATAAAQVITAPRDVKVPSLVGLSLAEARQRSEDAGLSVDVVARYKSLSVPAEDVLTQSPEGGVLREGTSIELVISDGLPRREIPNVVGFDEGPAQAHLRAAGFEIKKAMRRYSLEPQGTVIARRPSRGRRQWGSAISLVVSRGPRPINVPDTAGMTVVKAKRKLREAGFKVELVEDYSDDIDEGLVIGTRPSAGSTAPEASKVELVVSIGPRYKEFKMPDVRGMKVDAARAKLKKLNLHVSVVHSGGKCSTGTTVIETDPIAGTKVRERDLVALFIC